MTKRLENTESKLDKATSSFEEFKLEYETEHVEDVLTFADQSERLDFNSNMLKANCVLITGRDLSFIAMFW